MTEIGTPVSMGSLARPPQMNYQDIYISWSAARDLIRNRNEVISARNSYQRTKENQRSFEKAMARLGENNGEISSKMLKDLILKDPDDFVAQTELGNIYCNNKLYADAWPLYKHAAELKPDYVNAWFGLGRADLALKNVVDAIDVLTAAYKLAPDSADVNHFIGEAYLQNKQGALAIKYMRRAIEISPEQKADLHLRIAWLYDAAGAKNLAAEEYKLLLQKKPNHPDKQKMLDYIAANLPN